MNNLQVQEEKVFEYEANGELVTLSEMDVVNNLISGNGNVTPKEVMSFMMLCKYQKLNPFLKEAYLIKFGNNPAQIITSKEAFMKRAEQHPQYDGFEAGIIVERNGEMVELEGAIKLSKDIIIGAWCKVYRKDRRVPITAKISYEEFSKNQSTWKSMPLTMIRKSAVVNGLREAFPENLGALYTEDDNFSTVEEPRDVVSIRQEIKENSNKQVLDFVDEVIESKGPDVVLNDKKQDDPFFAGMDF